MATAMPVAATIPTTKPFIAEGGLHLIQSDEAMPQDQRDVLEELLETPETVDLKPVFELYLNRNRKLADKDFQAFSRMLETTRELRKLEEQKKAKAGPTSPTGPDNEAAVDEEAATTAEAPGPPTGSDDLPPSAETAPIPSARPQTTAEGDQSPRPGDDDRLPPASIDLDFLYHGAKPMRPL